jgi:hypothetical protein
MRVSPAFLHLCVALGCPFQGEKLRIAYVVGWLSKHYEDFRAAAGLPALASLEGMSVPAASRLRVANAVITLLQYGKSRASDWRQKRQLRWAIEAIERSTDRA